MFFYSLYLNWWTNIFWEGKEIEIVYKMINIRMLLEQWEAFFSLPHLIWESKGTQMLGGKMKIHVSVFRSVWKTLQAFDGCEIIWV